MRRVGLDPKLSGIACKREANIKFLILLLAATDLLQLLPKRNPFG